MREVGYTTAFVAGLASFLSPCVMPLLPGYLSYISGVSLDDIVAGKGADLRRVFRYSVLFVLGFSVVFVAMGAAATAMGVFIQRWFRLLSILAGVIIILFGLQLLGVFRLRVLMAERRYQGQVRGGLFGAFLMGMAFALGWTPCVGPILFSILAYAGTRETVGQGIAHLACYSAGIGIPFLLIGLGMGSFMRLLDRFRQHLRWVEAASGALLVVFGILVLTGWLAKLSRFIP